MRRSAFVHEAMFALDQNIWSSSISLATKLRLYNACILPIFLYGTELWSVTSSLSKKIDALDTWCPRWILHIHWILSQMKRFGLLSDTIRGRRLSFFRHRSRVDPSQDHSRALQSCILGPPRDWRHRVGRPRQSWLRTVEDDLRPPIFGLASAGRRALDRSAWRLLVETATSTWFAPERESIRVAVNTWLNCSFLHWY